MEFIDEPCSFEIKREIAFVSWPNGPKLAFPIAVFRQQYIRAGNAIFDYDARKGTVVPIRGRKKS